MVYLNKLDSLVIFDRVQSLDPDWRKAWVCHFQGKPEVLQGQLVSAEVPGHMETFEGGTIEMTWGDGVLTPPDPDDPGRLFIRTLLPEQTRVHRIGGDGYEAWWDGRNRTMDSKKADVLIKRLDAGRWRIEVSPKVPKKFDVFLHVLHITDTKTSAMPSTAVITSDHKKMTGVSTGAHVILFGRKKMVEGGVSYTVAQGKKEHLLVDLKPSTAYSVTGTADGTGLMTTSPEGTLRFKTEGAATVSLAPKGE
jgi:hypothetical protein